MVGYFSSGRRRLSRARTITSESLEEKLHKWEEEEEEEEEKEEDEEMMPKP